MNETDVYAKEKFEFAKLRAHVPTCLWKITCHVPHALWKKPRPEILFLNLLKNAPFCMKFGTQP